MSWRATGRNENLGDISLCVATLTSKCGLMRGEVEDGLSFGGYTHAATAAARELKKKQRGGSMPPLREFEDLHKARLQLEILIHSSCYASLSRESSLQTAIMVRKLKHHEQKLLKKTDFITYKQVRSPPIRLSLAHS